MNKVFEHLSEDFEQLGQQAQPSPADQNPTLFQTSRLAEAEITGLLDQYTQSAINQMAARRGISANKYKKQLIFDLAKVLYQPASIQKILTRLSPEALDGLARIKRAGGSISLTSWLGQMQNRHGQAKTQQAQTELVSGMLALYGQHNYYSRQELDFRFHYKTELIWNTNYGYDQPIYLWSYSQVLNALPTPTTDDLKEAPGRFFGLDDPKTRTPASFENLLADIIAFLRYIELNKVKLLQSGGLGKRDFVKLNELMTVKEPGKIADFKRLEETGRLNFIWNLLTECQLVEAVETPDEYQFVQVRPGHSEEFYGLPRYRQARLLTGAWLRSNFNEFKRIPTLEFEEGVPARHTDIPDRQAASYARAQVLSVLEKFSRQKSLPVEQWLDLKRLVAIFRDRDPDFLVKHNSDEESYYYSASYGNTLNRPKVYYNGYYSTLKPGKKNRAGYVTQRYEWLEAPQDWDLVEGEWLAQLFAEPLAWLGLAELGVTQEGRPVAFRLTALGEAVLLKQPTEAEQKLQNQLQELSAADPNATKALLVQPNFDVMILAPLQHMALLRQMDRFADQTSLGDVAMYRISKDSFVRGLRSGLLGSEILETLEANSRVPVAQNVVASLNDWAAEFERLLLYEQVNLLEVPDAALLDRLLLTPQAAQLIAKRLSPTVVLLRGEPDRLTPLLLQLQNTKLSPVKVDYDEVKRGCIQAEGDQRLKIVEGAGNPFLYYRLGQFADLGQWDAARRSATFVLTPQAGQRAQSVGLTYDKVYDFLMHFMPPQVVGKSHRPPTLPPAMRVRLRGWLGYYSPANASRAIVLQVTQRTQLDDLMELAEFQAALLERSGPLTALLRESHFPALRDHIASLGTIISAPEFDPPTPIQVLPPGAPEPKDELPRRGRKAKGETTLKSTPKPKQTQAERERRQREEQETQAAQRGNLIPLQPSPADLVKFFSALGRGDLTLQMLGKNDLGYITDFEDFEDDFPPPPPRPPRLR